MPTFIAYRRQPTSAIRASLALTLVILAVLVLAVGASRTLALHPDRVLPAVQHFFGNLASQNVQDGTNVLN